jgi:hypothetical protein
VARVRLVASATLVRTTVACARRALCALRRPHPRRCSCVPTATRAVLVLPMALLPSAATAGGARPARPTPRRVGVSLEL